MVRDTIQFLNANPSSMFNTRNKIGIFDADDFNLVASDILTDFLSTFTIDNGLLQINPNYNSDDSDSCDDSEYEYSTRGHKLADRMINRLIAVGCHYFDNDEICVETHLYQEDEC